MNYVFMTDSDSDLPLELQKQHNIPFVKMPYTLNGKEYYDDLGQSINSKDYFEQMRGGAVPSTSALNKQNYIEYFEPILEKQDLLFVAFSSQLSCTINAARAARDTLLEKYPERKMRIVDTLSISAPMAILVLKAYEMYEAGCSMDEVADWIEANKLRAQAYFTVDDLVYLKRGGRISATSAALGTMLDLKPILIETKEGKLVALDKVRGRKKALNYLVEKTCANIGDPNEAINIILHADAYADAERLKAALEEKIPGIKLRIENIGPVIGAHAGPGTVAICFLGNERPM